MTLFKHKFPFHQRYDEASRILLKYPDMVPIICEKSKKDPSNKLLEKNKYLVPHNLTIGQFMYVIRKNLKLPAENAIFLFINGFIPPASALISNLYDNHKDPDKFLYISYSFENTFGIN